MNKYIIRNLSKALEKIAETYHKAIASQRKTFSFLAWIALNNRIALDYLLVTQGGVYAIANFSCCPWINTSQQVELETSKLLKLVKYLREHLSFTAG